MPYFGKLFVSPSSVRFLRKASMGEVELNGEEISWEIQHWQYPQQKDDVYGTWNIYVTIPVSWFDPKALEEDADPYLCCDAMPPCLGECTYACRMGDTVRLGVDFAHGYDDKFYSVEEMMKKLNRSFSKWDFTNLPFSAED